MNSCELIKAHGPLVKLVQITFSVNRWNRWLNLIQNNLYHRLNPEVSHGSWSCAKLRNVMLEYWNVQKHCDKTWQNSTWKTQFRTRSKFTMSQRHELFIYRAQKPSTDKMWHWLLLVYQMEHFIISTNTGTCIMFKHFVNRRIDVGGV